MTVSDLKEMAAAGFKIGSHTVNHETLTGMSDKQLDYEFKTSRDELQKLLGIRIYCIAYPCGFANDRVMKEAKNIMILPSSPASSPIGHRPCSTSIVTAFSTGIRAWRPFSARLSSNEPVTRRGGGRAERFPRRRKDCPNQKVPTVLLCAKRGQGISRASAIPRIHGTQMPARHAGQAIHGGGRRLVAVDHVPARKELGHMQGNVRR